MKGFDKKRWIAAGIAVIMAAAMPVTAFCGERMDTRIATVGMGRNLLSF